MLKSGIFRNIWQSVDALVTGRGRVDENLFDEFEEALLSADLSVKTTDKILRDLRSFVRNERLPDAAAVRDRLAQSLIAALGNPADTGLKISATPPTLYLMVGVNGVGKTTSLGKLAYREAKAGKKVMLAAGDTFRAAAADQLGIWAERAGADFIRQHEHSDPAAVVYDAINAAKTRGTDLILVDTAGRLHTKSNLMEELRKIGRVCERELGRKPDEILLALDATTGQNAVRQAQEFIGAVGVTGIVLAKLDGTARGGIVITLREQLGVPVKLVGVGEQPGDLLPFDPATFVEAMMSD
ncbi:MAG: signal recognition particle-docking protein FtsY [Capsulimonadales bacterium]|nr:signal recognition particle-docking protein FtsY [Capsulimonadales bacterium]